MASQKGRDLLLKLDDGLGNFVTVAGIRANRLAFNAQPVDATSSQSIGHWRELLGGAGVRKASISGNGIFKDVQADETIRAAFFSDALANWQIAIPDFGIVEGPFQITQLEYSGTHNGELAFVISLESAGALTFVQT
ncbi:MAG: phage major tail protein, TP901-1 family [Rhizobiaceae bacterium]